MKLGGSLTALVIALNLSACAGAPPADQGGPAGDPGAALPTSSAAPASAPSGSAAASTSRVDPGVGSTAAPATPPVPGTAAPSAADDEAMFAADRATLSAGLRGQVDDCARQQGAACEQLGNHFRTTDAQRAIAYYRLACDLDAFGGCHGWAFTLLDRPTPSPDDHALAWKLLNRACDGGFSKSCSMAGLQLYWGKGRPVDRPASAPYFRKACDAGEVTVACFNLAMMMAAEEIPGGAEGALALFTRGCDAEEKVACHNAGVLAESGVGGQKAPDAQGFFQRGCALGYADGCEAAKGSSGRGLASGKRSPTPTVAEWDQAAEIDVTGAKALGCETKMVREWLRVSCRDTNDTGGKPTNVELVKGGKVDTYRYVKGAITSLVTPFVVGVHTEARFSWSDKARTLVVTWPDGAPRPATVAAFQSR